MENTSYRIRFDFPEATRWAGVQGDAYAFVGEPHAMAFTSPDQARRVIDAVYGADSRRWAKVVS